MTEFRVGGPFQGSDILLLHHTGARGGRQRVSPLAFQWVGTSLAAAPRKIPVAVLEPVN